VERRVRQRDHRGRRSPTYTVEDEWNLKAAAATLLGSSGELTRHGRGSGIAGTPA
jgi:hypothetical protein